MDARRWEEIQALFHQAADRPPAEREAFLAGAGDGPAVAEVRSLLDAEAGAVLLDNDLGRVAQAILDDEGPDLERDRRPIGRYIIERRLGEGGMGVVYLASRPDLGLQVAIKLLRDGWLSPARRQRFETERRTLAQLQHPGIARLYDADTLPDGTPWFAMEFVDGVPLTDYCISRRLPLPERLRLFREVCDAVLYAHRRLVVHRDLKPSNIFVSDDGRVKLLDFGIAKHLTPLDGGPERTQTVLRLMTPAYAAPEQLRGERATVQSDVYALGVVLYELVAGRRPFDLSARTPAQAETMLLNDEPPRPSVVRVPGAGLAGRAGWADLDVLTLTAMHKDTRQRYASVEALARDVDHFLAGQPLDARSGRLLRYRAGKFVRRHWRSVLAAAAVLALVATLTGYYTARITTARIAAEAEATRTQRIQRFMLSLFREDEAGTAPAEDLRVVTLLDRGVREAGSLQGEPVLQAELYDTLGTINQQLARFDAASPLLESAVDLRRRLPDHGGAPLADSLITLGLLRIDQSRLDDADTLLREALDRARALEPGSPIVTARAMAAMGRLLMERDRNDEAIAMLEPAVQALERIPEARRELTVALTSLANAQFYAGHYDASLALNERGLALDRVLYGERHPSIGHDLLNIGSIHEQRGDLPDAVPYYRRGLGILRDWFGDDHPETASAKTILAQALRGKEAEEEALGLLRSALATQERVYGRLHSRVAFVQNALGGIALRAGRFDAAETAFAQTVEIYRAAHSPTHVRVGIATANLASVALARGDFARASRLLQEALDIYAHSVAPDHLNVGIARVKLGRALVGQRRFNAALDQLTEGVRIIERQSGPHAPWLDPARADIEAARAGLTAGRGARSASDSGR